MSTRKVTSVVGVLTLFAGGCSASWSRPIVAGPLYLGIGLYHDHRPRQGESADETPPGVRVVSVEGVGLLIALRQVRLGYTRLDAVVAEPGAEIDVSCPGGRVAAGEPANRWARESFTREE